MRKIVKLGEPAEWTAYRLTPGVDYQSIPELRDSLLKEQGYICAYCMRRIPHRDKNSSETSRIDHILCRENHDDLKLDYRNMVICCPGAINNEFHCDKLKDSNDVTFNLFDDAFINTISYKSRDGHISSSDITHNREMNDLINLNHRLIKKNRIQTLNGIITRLGNRKWKASDIRRELTQWEEKDVSGKYKPYCGIVIWYLKKKLRQA